MQLVPAVLAINLWPKLRLGPSGTFSCASLCVRQVFSRKKPPLCCAVDCSVIYCQIRAKVQSVIVVLYVESTLKPKE